MTALVLTTRQQRRVLKCLHWQEGGRDAGQAVRTSS